MGEILKMAKINNSVKFSKGLLTVDTMEILEEDKNGAFVYDLLETLRRFDGKCISLTIAEENPVQPKDVEEEE